MNKVVEWIPSLTLPCVLLSGFLTVSFIPQCALPAFAAESAETASNFLHDGEKTTNPWFHNENQIAGDKKTVSDAVDYIRRAPRDPRNYLNRADSYLYLMQPKEALKDTDTALALKPKDKEVLAEAYCIRGQALLQLKQHKAALDDLSKACILRPDEGRELYFRGMAKEKLGQLPQAIKDYATARALGFSQKLIQVDFTDYMERLQRRIKSRWNPPKGDKTKKTMVVFKIARNGRVSHLKVDKTSGIPEVDAAAILAVQQAAPFEALPEGAPKDVDIQFSFDYNVFGGGIQWHNAEVEALRKVAAAKKGKDEIAVIEAELKLAHIYARTGKYPAAIELYQNALQVLEKKPEQQLVYGKTFGRLAMVYSLQGKTVESETEFKKSLEIVDKDGGFPRDSEVAEILQEYAKVLYKAKKIDEANKIYARLKR